MVVNPRAGRNSGVASADAAERVLVGAGWEVTRVLTTCSGEAEELAARAAGEGHDAVFACGGDGTLSQVLEGLIGTGVPAGLIPAGTGNDFARTIGLSRDPATAAGQALTGTDTEIDLLDVDGGETWSLNIVGVGFDAMVAKRINRRARLTAGRTAYLIAVLQELFKLQPFEARIKVGAHEWEGRALVIAIANAQSYGAGMRIAPSADITDGLLDVVLVEQMGRLAFMWSFGQVFRGTHANHPKVSMWQGTEVTVETAKPRPALVDGELLAETPLHIRIAPKRGRIWMPGGLQPTCQDLRLEPAVE